MKKTIFVFLLLFFLAITVPIARAEKPKDATGGDDPQKNATVVTIGNPLEKGGVTSPQIFIGKLIKAVLGIVGSVALLMFIYGGFTWMTAAGNATRVGTGKNILLWAVIGLLVIFSSYALTNFVLKSLTQ